MKRIITLAAIVSIASFLTGCCFYGPYGYNCAPCGPYGGACDSCPATAATSSDLFTPCGVGGCSTGVCGSVYGPVCGPNYCNPCVDGYYGYPCCPLLTIVSIPFRIIEDLWMCAVGYWPNTGCSQIYWGEWSDPPCPDPCCFNNYAGPCSSRACGATACYGTVGCNSGCDSCDGGYGYGDGMIYDGGMEGEVIMDSAVPVPGARRAPGRPQVIQPTPAPVPGTTTSNCRNCNQNRQVNVPNAAPYRSAKTPNETIQQIQYQQPVQKTYAPAQPNNNVKLPADVMQQLPPGAVIVSDEVVSSQASVQAGGDAYAPVLTNASANQWKSAAVKRTAR